MEKEMVQKFDLEAAFKALDEIEAPKTKGLKANRVDLKERFAAKTYGDALVEDYYNINDHEALEEAKEDREEEVAKAKLARIEKIVDLDAESPEDLLPSYVGKVIIQCPQCMTLFYKNPEDIEKSEENPDVVNINEICQHCGNASGYTLIGKVGSVSEDEAANYEAAEDGTEEDELNLDFGEPTEEVSPEGTGGGFEEEEIAVEEGSEDSSDDELDLEAIDLEPTEESLQHEQLNEEVEDVKVEVKAEDILDAAAKAGKEVAKEAEADLTKAEVKEITDEVVTKELELPVVEEGSDDSSDDELDEALSPEQVEQKLTAYAASLGVEESVDIDKILDNIETNESLKEELAPDTLKAICYALRGVNNELDKNPKYLKNGKHRYFFHKNMPVDLQAEWIVEMIQKTAEQGHNQNYNIDDVIKVWDMFLAKTCNPEALAKAYETLGAGVVAEGYTGNPAERTTHLEYTDDDPTDGKAVLPNNIEKQLTEGTYDVSDADFRAMLKDKTFQEFGEALTEEKVEEGKVNTAAVEKAISEINAIGAEDVEEDINITNNDSPARVDNRKVDNTAKLDDDKHVEEGILGAIDSVVDGVVGGVKNLLASNEAEKKDIKECVKTEEGLGLLGVGDVNINLDASGQNNAVGFGGGEGKTESCEGPECKEEKHVCEKCGKEPCECKEEGLLPDLDNLPIPSLPGLKEKCEELHEESLNKHISDYLTEVYANVKDFTATDCSFKGNTLVVEGTINFNSGKTRTTKFEFTEAKNGEAGKIILEGYNKDLAEDAHFTLNCLLEDGGTCLLTEGFGYKYTINNTLVEGLK